MAPSPASDDEGLVDRIVAWAEEEWSSEQMATAAEAEGLRQPEGHRYSAADLWSVVTTPEVA